MSIKKFFIGEQPLSSVVAQNPLLTKATITAAKKSWGYASLAASEIALPIADRWAKNWLIRTNNPYYHEIANIANTLKHTAGVYALNLSYEFACTTGVYQINGQPVLLRILDWPFKNLGDKFCLVNQQGKAGDFIHATWSGYVGVLNGIAPNRFAAAINQAPMRRFSKILPLDWWKNRLLMHREQGLPPPHLLRQVFETAPDYQTAVKILCETPVSVPVIFTIAGIKEDEGCVIERTETAFAIRPLCSNRKNVVATNDFLAETTRAVHPRWEARPVQCAVRQQQAEALLAAIVQQRDTSKISFPMINQYTRLFFFANAASGFYAAQGWEDKKAVTRWFY